VNWNCEGKFGTLGCMSTFGLFCLIAAFFFTATISVVTGGSSLLTVPVMLSFGFEPHVAVATNMLALSELSQCRIGVPGCL
jgi:uncharacterized protein